MAIKIIEEKPDASVVKQAICRNCGVKLEYVPADIKWNTYSDYGGGSDTVGHIGCPKCREAISVGCR